MSPPPPPHQPPQQPPPQQPPPQQQPPPPPPQPQPQPQYYPYPYPYPHPHPRSKPTSKPFTSCILATFFLTLFLLASAITLYILFRPQNPNISIKTLKFPSFTPHNNTATATLSFTFLQLALVHNPNRYAFSHHGSQFELVSSSVGPLGSMYIPAGQIAGQQSKLVSAQFDVKDFSVEGEVMELESMMRLVGSVKVVQVFAHHVEETVRCRVSVRVADGSILGYHC